ncbi:hypothetical protein Q1695_002612 [Nippostrongylus brasiliensis]|nr:hypothetical protein Q1695_002612 [Nippostrongylus brasiliensis]
MLSSCSYTRVPWLMLILCAPNTLGYYVSHVTMLQISITKFCVFYPNVCPTITTFHTVIALAITWIFVAIIVVAATFTGFAKYFDRKTFAFSYTPNSAIWDAFYSAFGEVATTPIIFIAILIIYRVYKLSKHSTTRNNNGEIAAFFQFFVVSVFVWLSSFTFFILPYMVPWDALTIATLRWVTGTMSIISNSMVMIMFNYSVKRHMRMLMTRKTTP